MVQLEKEPQNPFDERAIKAIDRVGNTLGYLPRDGWLTEAIYESGVEPIARIKSVNGGEKGLLGVVLEVATAEEDLTSAVSGQGIGNGIGRFVKGLIRGLSK